MQIAEQRARLPIAAFKDHIVDAVENNQVKWCTGLDTGVCESRGENCLFLPELICFPQESDILREIRQVVLIAGETGCGKTTQVSSISQLPVVDIGALGSNSRLELTFQ